MNDPQTPSTPEIAGGREIVKVDNLSVNFDKVEVLKDLSFSLVEGERLAILGPGGCGKSTLLKTIVGIQSPTSGAVEVLGKDLAKVSRSERQEILRSVSMAFQQGALFDFMTVRENIIFAIENITDMSEIEREEKVVELLNSVNLPRAASKLPSELSGGMRRRVGVVRALAINPKLALLDEPTAGLDPVTTTVVINMIHALAEKTKSSLLCVTSSVEVAFTFSKRVAILKDGKIIGTGTWEELHALNDPWILNFLDVRQFTPPEDK